jgi:HSP20 family protein
MFIVPLPRRRRSALAPWARDFDRLFDEAFGRLAAPAGSAVDAAARTPALDVTESDRDYTVRLDMPGVTKEDVQVSVEGRRVSVQARTERAGDKKEGDRLLHRERSASSYVRRFTLPAELDGDSAAAKLEQGVLTLTLPKRSGARITVN